MSGSTGQAITWYDLALTLAPESAESYFWRGSANEERGTLALAEADFRRAADYSAADDLSSSTRAYFFYRWGNILAEKGNWSGAAAAFAQAAALGPEPAYYYRHLGDALSELGDKAAAAAAYQKADQND